MNPEIVIIGPMYPPTQARLEAEFIAHRLWEAPDQAAFLQSLAERVRGIAVYALHGCPAWVIEALPRLEIISCMGIGVDKVDLAGARARGIPVTNTPDVVTEDTADIALGLMLAVERHIAEGDRFVRRGDWLKGELPFGRALRRRRLGIIGLGRIGNAIATRAAAFGVSPVSASSRHMGSGNASYTALNCSGEAYRSLPRKVPSGPLIRASR